MMVDFGITQNSFFDDYNEKKFFLKRKAIESVYTWSHVDNTLFNWDFDSNNIKIHNQGIVEPSVYLENYDDYGQIKLRIKKHIFYEHLMGGSTISFNKYNSNDALINDLAMEIARFTRSKTHVNAYAAVGGSGTFDKHWDTHDVFAVQLIGRKRWRLYSTTFKNPLPHQKSRDYKESCPKEPILDVILEAGDLLYIPRGWWHEASPIDGEETFHAAIGTYPIKIKDYFEWVLNNKLPEHEVGRNYLFREIKTNSIVETINKFSELLSQDEVLSEFYNHVDSSARCRSKFNISGLLNNDDTKWEEEKFKINSILGIKDNGHEIMVNGLKLKLDTAASSYLRNIKNTASNDKKDLIEIIRKLNFLDVIS